MALTIIADWIKNTAEFSEESVATKLNELVNSGIMAKWSSEILDYATLASMTKAHFYVLTVS